MTQTTSQTPKEPLNVSRIFFAAIGLAMQATVPMTAVCILPVLAVDLVDTWFSTGETLTGRSGLLNSFSFRFSTDDGLMGFMWFLVQMVINAFMGCATVRIAYDTHHGLPVSISRAFAAGIICIVPASICVVAVTFAGMVGIVFLIIPGLLIFAVWFVILPVITIEGAGLQAFKRSYELTGTYVWSIVGLILFAVLISFIVMMLLGFGLGIFSVALMSLAPGIMVWGSFAMGIAGSIFLTAASGALVTLVYARLIEIKESSNMAEIFR